MQHHAGTDSRADVCRAGGQVAVLIVKRERQRFFKGVVEPVDAFPAVLQVEATGEHLQTQMVFFVDHYAIDLVLWIATPPRAPVPSESSRLSTAVPPKLTVGVAQVADVDVVQDRRDGRSSRAPRTCSTIRSRVSSSVRVLNGTLRYFSRDECGMKPRHRIPAQCPQPVPPLCCVRLSRSTVTLPVVF